MSKQADPRFYENKNSARPRNRLDRFWTNPWMTQELVKHVGEHIEGPIWECAAGRGDMSLALKEKLGVEVYSTDLDMSEFDYSIGNGHEKSFLDEDHVPPFGYNEGYACKSIITNPPYGRMTDKFIRKGLEFMEPDGIQFMAMLLRAEHKSGKSRADLYGECPHYMGELVLTTRPRWDYGDPDAPENAAPRHNFSWFLWKRNYSRQGDPIQIFSYMPKGFKP